MSKKINWELLHKPFGSQRLPGASQPKYTSGKEYMQKAMESLEQDEMVQETLQKAQPAMETLLKSRLSSKTPIVVVRPMHYQASEMVTQYNKIYDDKEGWIDNKADPRGSYFQDVTKSIRPGTQLVLKSLDPNLHEFIFEDQEGKEVVIPYVAKQQLMTSSNILDDVNEFLQTYKGE